MTCAATPAPPPAAVAAEDEGASCWICFVGGLDELGHPLRRDCSCRGGSGFAHLSCIVEYAKHKTEQWENGECAEDPWRVCPNCDQPYQGELDLDLANEYVALVKEEHPDDRGKLIGALNFKRRALADLLLNHLQSQRKDEVIQISNIILSMIGQMKTDDHLLLLPENISRIERDTYTDLGHIAYNEGTKEGAKTAMAYLEKCRDIQKELRDLDGVAQSENNIWYAKSDCDYLEGRSMCDNKEYLERRQKSYEKAVKKYGQENIRTLKSGRSLAIVLTDAHHSLEAERLLTKLAAISKRVHGPDHCITKKIEFRLQKLKEQSQLQQMGWLNWGWSNWAALLAAMKPWIWMFVVCCWIWIFVSQN